MDKRKKGGKQEIFNVLWEKISFWEKKGGGAKISIIQIIYTPDLSKKCRFQKKCQLQSDNLRTK